MGTRTSYPRSGRAKRRGLASFVSFLLLFAFALGQGSSLFAIADDGTDPLATEEVVSDGVSADGSVEEAPADEAPAEEAPSEEAPAEEAPAEEAPAEEAPAEEAPADETAVEEATGEAAASASSGGARTAPKKSQLKTARAGRTGGILSHGGIHGGEVNLDFVAAGPFTYDHDTGLGAYPDFGYNDRTIDKDSGVVESLEGGDFECGDLVTFFVEVEVEESAGSGSVALDLSFGNETTGQPGVGFDDIVSWGINTPDDGNVGLDGNETVTLTDEHIDTAGYDELLGTFTVSNLEGGETAIVRVTVQLACEIGATPTGNILNAINAARVVGGETISVGQETVPMKQVGGLLAEPAIEVVKDCPAEAAAGEEITYEITVTNTGNVDLTNVTVVDDIIGDLSDEFPDTLAVGSDPVTVSVQYTPTASDGDPVTNTVTATGDWSAGETSDSVSATANCTTDITHEPGILVVKECPASAPFGEDVTFTITVTNTGNEPLENVIVTDELLGGDITADFGFADPFPVGGEASAEFTYTPGADEDPVENSVTASGDGVDSGDTVTSTDACETDITHVPGIAVTKSCPELVGAGEAISYTITVSNTGNEALEGVTVVDTLLGDITAEFEFDDPFPVDGEATAVVSYTPGAGEDPVTNTVTASGTGEDSGVQASASASCTTDVSNPAIQIVKTVSEEVVPVGATVTYTFVVTNTGDVTLYDVTVDDNVMGHIGDIPVLEVGASVTLTKDFVVGTEPVLNVAVAEGHDILGRVVRDDDDALVSPILGENPPNPPGTPPGTPFTGSDAGRLGSITLLLLGIGATVVAATRRRRPEQEGL